MLPPNFRKYTKERSLLHRLKNGICELCGVETKEIVMHHVRRLKDLKGETEWERVMLRIRRKSLALCSALGAISYRKDTVTYIFSLDMFVRGAIFAAKGFEQASPHNSSRSQDYSRDKNGNLKRHWNGQVKLYLPHEKWFHGMERSFA